MGVVVTALAGAGVGVGVAVMLLGLKPGGRSPGASVKVLSEARQSLGPAHFAALAVGLVSLVVTRWPMALVLGTAGTLGLRGLSAKQSRSSIATLEAIAGWSEMLRDTLAGASGLSQALVATAPSAPPEIRPAVAAMAGRINGGLSLEGSLRQLADDIADPAADMLVAALVMASRERAQKLGDLLGALARSVRDEVTMRLRIEASRASSRTAVRMITGFSLALFALMALFARSYLAPYSSAAGQLALGFVGLLFAFGLWLMSLMVRPQLPPRLELSRMEQ